MALFLVVYDWKLLGREGEIVSHLYMRYVVLVGGQSRLETRLMTGNCLEEWCE